MGGCGDPADRHVADPARGRVDDAAERLVVLRVDDQPHVGEQVLDLLALIERHAAVYLVGYVPVAQRLLQRPRLRVGAIQHGRLAVGHASAVHGGVQVRGDQRGFLLVGVGLDDLDLLALIARRERLLADLLRVLLDDAVRGVHDVLRRAVVLLELEDLRVGEVVLEAQDVLDLRASERIDALRVVAHDADVRMVLGQAADDRVLREVRVLILVDQNVAELVLVFFQRVGEVPEQDIDVQQQVVEVHRPVFAAFASIELVNVQKLGPPPLAVFGLQGGVRLVGGRRDQVVLGQRDAGRDVAGLVGFVAQVQLSDRGLDHVLRVGRVVDRVRAGVSEPVGLVPENAGEDRVKSPHPQPARHRGGEQLPDPLAHLPRGLVREGQRQHRLRRYALLEHVGDAAGEHPGLSRAGPGHDQRGEAVVDDGLALHVVELFDVFGHFATSYDTAAKVANCNRNRIGRRLLRRSFPGTAASAGPIFSLPGDGN